MSDNAVMHFRYSRLSGQQLLVALALLLVGCMREDAAPADAMIVDPFEVLVEPAQLSLRAGETASLAAQVNDTRRRPIGGAGLTFKVGDPSLLRVSPYGNVTAIGPVGRSSVIVTSGVRERTVPVLITAGEPRRLEILSGDGLSVVAGEAVPSDVSARLLDQFGNAIGGESIVLELPAEPDVRSEATTELDGSASLAVPVLNRAGTSILTVRHAAGPDLSTAVEIDVRPGPVVELVTVGPPAAATEPSAEGIEIVVQARDASGNPVPDVDVNFTAAKGAGRVEPGQTKTDVSGLGRTRWHVEDASAKRWTLDAAIATDAKIRAAVELARH